MSNPVQALDLNHLLDKEVEVIYASRHMRGILKGWEHSFNLVIDNAVEYRLDPETNIINYTTGRNLGRVICRSNAILSIFPVDGHEEISNPFVQDQE